MKQLFGAHSYGKPVLGTKEELLATDESHLRDFHQPLLPAGQRRAGGRRRPGGGQALDEVSRRSWGDRATTLRSRRNVGVFGAPPRSGPPGVPARSSPASSGTRERCRAHPDRAPRAGRRPSRPPGAAPPLTLLAAGRACRVSRTMVDRRSRSAYGSPRWTSPRAWTRARSSGPPRWCPAWSRPGWSPASWSPGGPRRQSPLGRGAGAVPADRHRRLGLRPREGAPAGALGGVRPRPLRPRATSTATWRACSPPAPSSVIDVAARYLRPQNGGVLGWSLPQAVTAPPPTPRGAPLPPGHPRPRRAASTRTTPGRRCRRGRSLDTITAHLLREAEIGGYEAAEEAEGRLRGGLRHLARPDRRFAPGRWRSSRTPPWPSRTPCPPSTSSRATSW